MIKLNIIHDVTISIPAALFYVLLGFSGFAIDIEENQPVKGTENLDPNRSNKRKREDIDKVQGREQTKRHKGQNGQLLSPAQQIENLNKKLASQNHMETFLYHGIGTDITTLNLICKNGILSREYAARNNHGTGFVQKWGVNSNSITGGFNGASNISVSKAFTPAFKNHSVNGISIILKKDDMKQRLLSACPRGAEEGECQIQGGSSAHLNSTLL